jgi:hypothetical protein
VVQAEAAEPAALGEAEPREEAGPVDLVGPAAAAEPGVRDSVAGPDEAAHEEARYADSLEPAALHVALRHSVMARRVPES